MPYRKLGKTGEQVSLIGVGGFHIGYETVSESEAIRIMHAAIDGGMNFFDNSWDYNGGLSEERMGRALAMDGKRKKVFLMTKFCCHRQGWNKKAAFKMLDESLARLKTDYLDLWQIHEVIQADHAERAFMRDSAADALLEGKKSGKVRYIGFTGHRDPAFHLEMLSHDFPFDTVQMPLNLLDAHFLSFEKQLLPELTRREIGVIGMKPLGGGHETSAIVETGTVEATECLHYAMNLPVSTVLTGMTSMRDLEQALHAARSFRPFTSEERARLLSRTREIATTGAYELYKTA
ncbi:aldo/keto reductase [Acidobacteria bacterium AH-259-O06]|nr:aldo/keto reductase [Acidobacteria bacterium AH-259-O06]